MNMEGSRDVNKPEVSGREDERHDYLASELVREEEEHELVLDQHDLEIVHSMRESFIKLIESDPVNNAEKIAELGDFLIKID